MSFETDIEVKKFLAVLLMIGFFGLLVGGAYLTRVKPPPPETPLSTLPFLAEQPDFTLPSVNGNNYTFYNDTGKIRVVTFFYTKCPGTQGCALVSQLMFQLYSRVLQNATMVESVRFLSIDFDYINDTMQDLITYASSYTQNTTQWNFLLGNENQTLNVTKSWNFDFSVNNSTNSTLSLSHGDGTEPEPYTHSLIVYFVDQNNNLRYYVLGNDWDVQTAFEAIQYMYNNPTG